MLSTSNCPAARRRRPCSAPSHRTPSQPESRTFQSKQKRPHRKSRAASQPPESRRQDHHLDGHRRNHIFQIAADRLKCSVPPSTNRASGVVRLANCLIGPSTETGSLIPNIWKIKPMSAPRIIGFFRIFLIKTETGTLPPRTIPESRPPLRCRPESRSPPSSSPAVFPPHRTRWLPAECRTGRNCCGKSPG